MIPHRVTLIGGPEHGTVVSIDRGLREIEVGIYPDDTRPGSRTPTSTLGRTVTYHVHPWLEVALTPAVNAMGTREALNVIAATLDTTPGYLAHLILDRMWEHHHRNGKAHQ